MPDVVYTGHLTSALYLDKRENVGHYTEVIIYLSTEALTSAESRRFLVEIIQAILVISCYHPRWLARQIAGHGKFSLHRSANHNSLRIPCD